MDRRNPGSNDSSSSTQISQSTSSSSFTGTSLQSGVYKPQYSILNYNNNVVRETNPKSPIFTPFQSNWNSENFNNNPLRTSNQYQGTHQNFPTRHQSLGNYKNLDSLDLNFQNMDFIQRDTTSSKNNRSEIGSVNKVEEKDDLSLDNFNRLKFEVKQKDELITSLKLEITRLQMLIRSQLDVEVNSVGIPATHYRLFERLSSNMLLLQNKYNESELYLESLLTAIALNPQQSITDNGRYDVEEIAHKIISKLKSLQDENNEMLKMLSYGRSKQKDIELLLLRARVKELENRTSQQKKT